MLGKLIRSPGAVNHDGVGEELRAAVAGGKPFGEDGWRVTMQPMRERTLKAKA